MELSYLPALITVAGTLVISIITLTYTHWAKSREDRLKRKQEMYDKLLRPYIAYFHEILAKKHNVEPLTQKKIGDIAELSLILPMYVPDQLFRAFQKVQQKGTKLDSTFDSEREKVLTEYYLALGDLLLEVRKDLGFKRTSLKGADIIRNVVRDIDDYAKKYGL
jgi:hypothetical protein